jgi:hypothetical protein
MKFILDEGFRYKPSFDTNVRKTFERIRKQQVAEQRARDCAPWFDDSTFARPKAPVRELKTTTRSS